MTSLWLFDHYDGRTLAALPDTATYENQEDLLAALAAEGETRVSQICHIDRGYEDLARDLRALGADAVRVEETENG